MECCLQRQALRNIAAILEGAHSKWQDVLKVNIFLTEMSSFAAMNEAWDEVFIVEYKPVSD
jgi:enamine deaminase RidA (YjgF/YER057c/UK114 family)